MWLREGEDSAIVQACVEAGHRRRERTVRPVVVTRKGKSEAVVMDSAVFERRLQIVNLASLLAEAEADVRAGRIRPAEEFLRELDQAKAVSS